MLQPIGIVWVGLFAESLPRLVAFYSEIVGLRLVDHDERFAIFDAGGGALFEIWGGGNSAPGRKSSNQQSVLVGFLVPNLEAAVEELKSRGLAPESEIDGHLGTRWVDYIDPEGNRFELKDRNV
jgi:predicted enzyme related to lactoylglutathione lyase